MRGIFLFFVTILVLVTLMGYWLIISPMPSRHLSLATGGEGGAYYAFGQEYKKLFAEKGFDLEVISTSGSIDNVRKLKDKASDIDFAFVQSGIFKPEEVTDLVTLGSVYLEPLWVFYRSEENINNLADLKGKKIAIGSNGSGTQAVALRLLADNGLAPESNLAELVSYPMQEAKDKLEQGEVDAIFVIAGIYAPVINELLDNPQLKIMDFSTLAQSYTSRYRFLSSVNLPEGVISLEKHIPAQSITLLAPSAMLVAHKDIHRELIPLILETAYSLHDKGDVITPSQSFPSADFIDIPLHPEARHYLNFGPRPIYHAFSYNVAIYIDHFKAPILLFIIVLLILLVIVPVLQGNHVNKKINRWYMRLYHADKRLMKHELEDLKELHIEQENLQDIEEELLKLKIPSSHLASFYNLRLHLFLLEENLEKKHQKLLYAKLENPATVKEE